MTEDEKKMVASFRFGVICDLVNGVQLASGEQEQLLRDKCARKWQIPFSNKTRISRSTILRWMRLYKNNNGRLEALYPAARSDRGQSRALDQDTALALIELRRQMPKATIKQLIEQMHRRGLVASWVGLSPSTVYRFLRRHGLTGRAASAPVDRRKFEAELPNDLWQSDVMHGPRVLDEGKNRKTYLIALIDDHSRLITHGQFYLSEKLICYLDCLEHALLRRGLPRKLYVDNGPAFRSRHLEHVTAALGIALIHAKPYQPQGKGKIERFFRTVRGDFLSGFKGDTLHELNEAFDLWITDLYHKRKHSATGQSPFARFTNNLQCLRPAPDNLKDHFRQRARRRVAKDRTITLNGRLFEAPVALIGRQVELLYHNHSPEQVEILFKQRSYGMAHSVHLHVNCRVKRDKNRHTQITPGNPQHTYRGGNLL
jgi:transposase InsO family protein